MRGHACGMLGEDFAVKRKFNEGYDKALAQERQFQYQKLLHNCFASKVVISACGCMCIRVSRDVCVCEFVYTCM